MARSDRPARVAAAPASAAVRRWCRAFTVAIALASVWPAAALDDELAIPADLQLPLLLKVLSYDRQLARVGDTLSIGLLYQPLFPAATRFQQAAIEAAAASSVTAVQGLPFTLVPLPIEELADVAPRLASPSVDVVWVAPLRAVPAAAVAQALRGAGLLGLGSVPDHARRGLAVSLDVRGERPRILINLAAARAAGAAFSSRLLSLAVVELVP